MFSSQKFFRWIVAPVFIFIFLEGCAPVKGNLVCFNNQCFTVEVVQKEEDLERGLMHRSYLGLDKGMLFIFPEMGRHAFWMKNTLIPLDILWLDYAHRVVDMAVDVPPCKQEPCVRYVPAQGAMYVLEINAHRAQAFGLKKGQVAEFKLKNF